MMIGASAAVQRGVGPQAALQRRPVLVVTSDAGIAYSMFELDTAAKYKIPIIAVIYNNNSWGMWPSARRVGRARCTCTCSRRICATTRWPKDSARAANTCRRRRICATR